MLPRDFRTLRLLVLPLMLAVAGCGSHAAAQAPPTPKPSASPSSLMAASTPSPQASASLTPSKPSPPPAAPVAAAPMPLQFPLVAVTGGVRGLVTVTTLSGSYRLQVQASGLPPGSAHSVHLHFGNCPSTGVHISVLGTLVANGSGAGSLTVTVGRPYAGNGRFVIIYTGPVPGPLAACAQLAN